ncbi:hypothetical protein R1sor_005711 [Riccia sorocarpa]|uniref:Reverse transcriptase zinc-binding domain-containing protein n=1 Tax=Riccia sorocarpa TaxID=122646 RepID=A0ABD3HPQ7_9MARC
MLLIKHVLSAIPSHHIMTVGLNSKGLARVRQIFRCFLWGYNAEGKPKTVLIAWDKLLRPLECGGLAWSDLHDRMHSQLASKCIRILKQEPGPVNWIRLATAIMQKHNTGKDQSSWTLQDCLLLSPCSRVKHAPVFSQILASWSEVRPYLTIPENTLEIPRDVSLLKLERLLTASGYNLEGHITKWRKWCRKLNWKATADLINDHGGWKHMEDELREMYIFPKKWIRGRYVTLKQDWKKLWGAASSLRNKLEIWRYANHGFFTNSRALSMGVDSGICKACDLHVETCEHLSWNCPRLRSRKNQLIRLMNEVSTHRGPDFDSLGEFLSTYMSLPTCATLSIQLAATWIREVWKERNKLQFQGTRSTTPFPVVLTFALQEIRARHSTESSTEISRRAGLDAQTLDTWIRLLPMRVDDTLVLPENIPATHSSSETSSSDGQEYSSSSSVTN